MGQSSDYISSIYIDAISTSRIRGGMSMLLATLAQAWLLARRTQEDFMDHDHSEMDNDKDQHAHPAVPLAHGQQRTHTTAAAADTTHTT